MDCVHWRESCGADPVGKQKGVSIAVPTVCGAPLVALLLDSASHPPCLDPA